MDVVKSVVGHGQSVENHGNTKKCGGSSKH